MRFDLPRLNLSRRDWLRSAACACVAGASWQAGRKVFATEPGRWKVGCSARSLHKLLPSQTRPGKMTVADFIQKCAAWQCECVELQDTSLLDTSDESLLALKEEATKNSLELSAVSVYTDFIQPKDEVLAREITRIRGWIDNTAKLGAEMLVVFPGSGKKGVSSEQAINLVASALKELASDAKRNEIVIAIENHGMFVDSADAVLSVAEKVDHSHVGINLDTGNFRANYYENMRVLAPKAVNCHVKLELGKGKRREPADLRKTVGILQDSNYRGRLVLQYEVPGDPLKEVPRYLAELKSLSAASG